MKDCKKMTSHKIELETEIKDSKKNKGLQRLIWNELKKDDPSLLRWVVPKLRGPDGKRCPDLDLSLSLGAVRGLPYKI